MMRSIKHYEKLTEAMKQHATRTFTIYKRTHTGQIHGMFKAFVKEQNHTKARNF